METVQVGAQFGQWARGASCCLAAWEAGRHAVGKGRSRELVCPHTSRTRLAHVQHTRGVSIWTNALVVPARRPLSGVTSPFAQNCMTSAVQVPTPSGCPQRGLAVFEQVPDQKYAREDDDGEENPIKDFIFVHVEVLRFGGVYNLRMLHAEVAYSFSCPVNFEQVVRRPYRGGTSSSVQSVGAPCMKVRV